MNETTLPIILGTILFAVLVLFLISFVVLYRRAQYKFKLERQAFLNAQLETEIEIREQTLSNISRDLHDNFGQIASLIRINLSMLKSPKEQADQQRLDQSVDLLKQLIADMRSLSESLNSDKLITVGLAEMMRKDLERVEHSGFLQLKHSLEPVGDYVENDSVVFLYRIFQELLNNVIKHAEATELKVELSLLDDKAVRLWVKDDGKGMNLNEINRGSGLNNIEDRCKMIQARLNVRSSLGSGTEIEIILGAAKRRKGHATY